MTKTLCVALLLVMSGQPVPAFAAGVDLSRFEGQYRLAAQPEPTAAKAVDQAVAPMSFFVRGVARKRLQRNTIVYPKMSIGRTGTRVQIAMEGGPKLVLSLAGTPVGWKSPTGESVRVSLLDGGSSLIQRFQAKDGVRENRLSLSEDGQVLTVATVVKSSRIPKPVQYLVTYRREKA